MDGNPNTNFLKGSCSHTQNNNLSWWRVDLGSDHVDVSEVHIVNRFSQHVVTEDYKITFGEFCYPLINVRSTMHTSPHHQLLNKRPVWMLQEFLKPRLSCFDLVINRPRCVLLVIAQSIQGLSLRFTCKYLTLGYS